MAVNSFVPALLAVLLAEIGGRSATFARLPRPGPAVGALGLLVGAAAAAGYVIAPTMNARARALMLGLALLIAAASWFERRTANLPATAWSAFLLAGRTNAPFLAFAFAIWKSDAIGAAAGALAGVTAAVALVTLIPPPVIAKVRAGALAGVAILGVYAALWALRLIA